MLAAPRRGGQVLALSGAGFIVDSTTDEVITRLRGHRAQIADAAFSADDARLIIASRDGTARVWDAEAGSSIAELVGHTGGVNRALLNPDSTLAVTGGEDGTVRIWDGATGRAVETVTHHGGEVRGLALVAGGTSVISAGLDGEVRIASCLLCLSTRELFELASSRVTRDLTEAERSGQLRGGR